MVSWRTVLRGALPGGLAGLPALRAHLRGLPSGDARQIVDAMFSAWIDGTIGPGDWEVLTGDASSANRPRRAMHVVWDALVADHLAPSELERYVVLDDASIERWAWSPRWTLMSQDEDLLLFGHAEALLRVAADAECPKRAYALEIAAHDVRDQASAAVSEPAARQREDPFALAARLAPLARASHADEVAAYFERLAGYSRRAPVDRDGALDRARDLRRCAPPAPDAVEVRVAGDAWVVAFRERPAGFVPAFCVHRKTGAMRRAGSETR